jgi:hypothetical protein
VSACVKARVLLKGGSISFPEISSGKSGGSCDGRRLKGVILCSRLVARTAVVSAMAAACKKSKGARLAPCGRLCRVPQSHSLGAMPPSRKNVPFGRVPQSQSSESAAAEALSCGSKMEPWGGGPGLKWIPTRGAAGGLAAGCVGSAAISAAGVVVAEVACAGGRALATILASGGKKGSTCGGAKINILC